MVHEFIQRISVETPLGHGYAIFVEIGSEDHFWTIALDSGAVISFTQDRIKLSRCYGLRRNITDNQMREIIDGKTDHTGKSRRKRK